MTRAKRAIKGAGLVASNHVVSALITVASALILSRVLGPQVFAIYALASSISAVTRIIARLGVNASLLTQREEPTDDDYYVALATMLISSVVVACVVIVLLPYLESFSRVSNVFWPATITVLLLPFHVLSLPAITRLERRLRFKPLIIIDLAAQVSGQVVGVSMAINGYGINGPLTGWVIRELISGLAPWFVIGLWPKVSLILSKSFRMVKFGLGYVAASSVSQSRNMVFLSIVGRVLGPEAVGYFGLTLRAAGLIAPFRAAAGRVGLPALVPIAHLPDSLRNAVRSVVETELLFSVPITILAVGIYSFSVKHLLGAQWMATVELFPGIAAGALLASAHATSLNVIHIRGYFMASIISSCVGIISLTLAVFILSHLGGINACSLAAIFAWPALWVQEWFARKKTGIQWSRNGVAWAIGGTAACLAFEFGVYLALVSLVMVVVTATSIRNRVDYVFTSLCR
jgi:lipopolysaccharide exporter